MPHHYQEGEEQEEDEEEEEVFMLVEKDNSIPCVSFNASVLAAKTFGFRIVSIQLGGHWHIGPDRAQGI
eukprot:4106440-Pyramimonas_sp.AAC.1